MGQDLAGLSIVVTGGTRGFGSAMARAFVAHGAGVTICGRDENGVAEAVELLASRDGTGDRVHGERCDAGDLDQVRALASAAVARSGHIDVWVNNAGIAGPYGELETIRPDRFEEVVRTNVLGCYHGTLAALEHMLPASRGKIINIGGLGADGRAAPRQVAYSASKAWIRSFTLSVAKEHDGSGVGLFVLNPGLMVTDMTTLVECTTADGRERLERMPTVLRIIGRPPDAPAERAVWLASSATDGRTGLVIDDQGRLKLAGQALKELGRRLTGRSGETPDVEVRPPD